jgi:hypothetical protein
MITTDRQCIYCNGSGITFSEDHRATISAVVCRCVVIAAGYGAAPEPDAIEPITTDHPNEVQP